MSRLARGGDLEPARPLFAGVDVVNQGKSFASADKTALVQDKLGIGDQIELVVHEPAGTESGVPTAALATVPVARLADQERTRSVILESDL